VPHYVLDARTTTPHYPGIGRYVTNLARALIPLLGEGERLTLLHTPGHPLRLPERTGFAQQQPVAAGPFGLRQQWEIPRLLHRLNADLYHSTYFLMPYHPGVPTVLTIYDLIPLLFPEAGSRRAALLFRTTLNLALRAAGGVITLSEAARRDLGQLRALLPPVTTIPAAADPDLGPQPAHVIAAVCARYNLPASFLLYLGSNKPHKNLTRLVEAFHLLKTEYRAELGDTALVIAGAWDSRYSQPRQLATELGLEAEIRWLGAVPGSELPALYAAATAFVFPSIYEGFGLPPLEALACGTPVACSRTSSLPEVVGDAAILFDPLSHAAIAKALASLLGDAALRANLRERGLQRAAQFSWGRAAAATLALYRQAIR
jgi:glycosyltransferase involved in cell wall biosynthesis